MALVTIDDHQNCQHPDRQGLRTDNHNATICMACGQVRVDGNVAGVVPVVRDPRAHLRYYLEKVTGKRVWRESDSRCPGCEALWSRSGPCPACREAA